MAYDFFRNRYPNTDCITIIYLFLFMYLLLFFFGGGGDNGLEKVLQKNVNEWVWGITLQNAIA